MSRATRARIYPARLRHNAGRVRAVAPDSRIMACVKADAYGHGTALAAAALGDLVDGFAVASIEEARAVRQQGMQHPVLLLEGPHSADEIAESAAAGFVLCISESRQLDWLEAGSQGSLPACWIKIDSGMHRLGFLPAQLDAALSRLRSLALPGELVACTHFASADHADDTQLREQLAVFDSCVAGQQLLQSTANSAAILGQASSHRDWVRPGYMLYGGSPFAHRSARELGLEPAMEFSAEVISVREVDAGESVGYAGRWTAQRPSRIATVAAGYGDGYPRHAPDGTPVSIAGRRLPLAGRVSMDMITVDVTEHPAVSTGAKAVLWGEDPTVDEIAARAGTIGYELLAGMPARVPRVLAE